MSIETTIAGDWQRYGRFDDERREFVITAPTVPLPWDNHLFNERYLSIVDHLGRGWSKLHTREGYVTFLWHLSAMYERDENRYVYLRDEESGRFWSVATWPAAGASEYECRHGLGYTEISSKCEGIGATLRIMVPPGQDPVELWTITLQNRGKKTRSIGVFTYGQVSLRGVATHGYMHFCQGRYLKDLRALFFENNAPGLPHARYKAFQAADFEPSGTDASRNTFRGMYRTLANPAAVVEGKCFSSQASREPMAACFWRRVKLEPGQSLSMRLLAGIVDSAGEAADLIEKYLRGEGPQEAEHRLAAAVEDRLDAVWIETPSVNVDRLINVWAKQQVALGATWGRWGWRGYSDIVQQTQGATYLDLRRAESNLCEAMTWQMRDGFCVRGWAPFSPKRYADSALWLCYAVNDYVKESGEKDFVQRVIPYRNGGAGPVWEHLLRGCEKGFSDAGPHGLPLIHQGDWNDSLSAVGEKGMGESVWIAEAVCWALLQLNELFEAVGLAQHAKQVWSLHREMADRVNEHAWDGKWYVRCFKDDGEPIGSARNSEGSCYINSQTWAILGEVATSQRQAAVLEALEKQLRVPYGYLTLSPPYTQFDPSIGRITGMPPGTGENAAVYVHANAFLYAALLKLEKADAALELLEAIHPCNGVNPTSNSCAPPYILPNSYYGPAYPRPGRIEGTWVTGSASWFLHQTIEGMCGVRRTHEGLLIRPCLPAKWNEVRVRRRFRGAEYDVHIERSTEASGIRVEMDGKEMPEGKLGAAEALSTHGVRVMVGR